MQPLNVGIIGYGRIGAEHARWLSVADGMRAVAVADVTPARRELAQARGLTAFASIDELLVQPGIDAMLVSTPTAMHFDHAMAALAAGKHVMVEKPMTLDLEHSRQHVSACPSDVGFGGLGAGWPGEGERVKGGFWGVSEAALGFPQLCPHLSGPKLMRRRMKYSKEVVVSSCEDARGRIGQCGSVFPSK